VIKTLRRLIGPSCISCEASKFQLRSARPGSEVSEGTRLACQAISYQEGGDVEVPSVAFKHARVSKTEVPGSREEGWTSRPPAAIFC